MSKRKTPELLPHGLSTPILSLAVQYASTARNQPTRAQLRRWIKAALRRDVSMTLRIVDEAEGRELNKGYRGKDYATNVLTFVYGETQSSPCMPSASQPPLARRGCEESALSGDVVICAPVVEQEARKHHKDLMAHYAHLAIHATLHLQGYEHEKQADAAKMEALETQIMLKLHYSDPYQEA